MPTNQEYAEKIVHYFNHSVIDYKAFWNLRKNMALHYGYWNKGTKTLGRALRNMNDKLACYSEIKEGEYVLDAGCGVGGSAIYLAKNYHCKILGISLVESQIKQAKINAIKNGVDTRTAFEVMDFTQIHIADGSFDVVWGLESICYAQNKADFIQEAYRVLKPGGRIVIGDGFFAKDNYSQNEKNLLDTWLHGWSLLSLDTAEQFKTSLENAGFQNIEIVDVTKYVLPTSRYLYALSIPGYIGDWTLRQFHLRDEVLKNNVIAARKQYEALKKDLWKYCIIRAKK